jgi:hypothetical protein
VKRLALAVLAVALLACGCGHPLIPAADVPSKAPAKAVPAASAADAAASSGTPVVGVDVYANGNYPAAEVQADGERMMTYVKKTLKADAVGIVWNLYATSDGSDTVNATSKTLSPANLEILTEIAQQEGLRVYYRPLIFVAGKKWEGNIAPSSPASWFRSYYQVELPYLEAAQQFHVDEFVAETEMHDLNGNPGWTGFFQRIAKVYHGTVSYASWDGDFFPPDSHLQDLPALGMDFYEKMPQLPASASPADVLAGWESFFGQMPRSVLKRTTIQEMGIEARAGAYADPPNLGAAGPLDEKVQANWFTAACQAVHKYDMRGIFFWKVDLTDNPYHPTTATSVFEGRLGASAIASCHAIIG